MLINCFQHTKSKKQNKNKRKIWQNGVLSPSSKTLSLHTTLVKKQKKIVCFQGHFYSLAFFTICNNSLLTLLAMTAAHSAMIFLNSAVSSAPFCVCNAIFSANLRGFEGATVGLGAAIVKSGVRAPGGTSKA
jgi:hypothetical protein